DAPANRTNRKGTAPADNLTGGPRCPPPWRPLQPPACHGRAVPPRRGIRSRAVADSGHGVGTTGATLPGSLRTLSAGRGAAGGRGNPPPTGRDHTRASPPDSRRAWSDAATARDRAARPARPPPPGRTGRHDRDPDRAVGCLLAWPDPARGRGPRPRRRGSDEPADRPGAVHHPQDRRRPRLTDPGQAWGYQFRGKR